MGQVNEASIWLERVAALEGVLGRAGRTDLLTAAATVRTLAGQIGSSSDRGDVLPRLQRALAEIKACIVDRNRHLDTTVLKLPSEPPVTARHAARIERVGTPDPRESGVQMALTDDLAVPVVERVTMPPDTSSEQDRGAWADSILAGFGGAQDDELDSLLGNIQAARRVRAADDLGTLREPLARAADSKKGDEARPSSPREPGSGARVLMKGEIHHGLLADLVQLFAQNAETGELVVESDVLAAQIFFEGGRVVDASSIVRRVDGSVEAESSGEASFFLAMRADRGRFSYQRGVAATERRIQRSAQSLIMEALRLMDEVEENAS